MTITTVSIACDVGLPNNTEFTAARLDFTLSGPDYDTVSNDSIPAATVSVTLDAAGTGTASLWPVDRGTRNTFYSVVLHGSRTVNGRVVSEALTLGRIQPQSAGGADLANLLAQSSGGIVVGSTIYDSIADAVAAALDAAVSAEADAATATTQAGIATTQAGISTAGAQSAASSADEAEAFAAAAAAVGATFPSVAAGIAGVADGEVFFVPITGGIGLTIYQRAGAGASVIGSVQGDTFDTRAAYAAWVAAGGVPVAGRTYWVGGLPYQGAPGATWTGLTGLITHPLHPVTLEHYGGGTSAAGVSSATNDAALAAWYASVLSFAQADRVLNFGYGSYGHNTWPAVDVNNAGFRGVGPSQTIMVNLSTTSDGPSFGPAEGVATGNTRFGCFLEGIQFTRSGTGATAGTAVTWRFCAQPRMSGVRISQYYNQMEVIACQDEDFSDYELYAPFVFDTVAPARSNSFCLRVRQGLKAGATYQAKWQSRHRGFNIAGCWNTENVMILEGGDGSMYSDGYVNGGRNSLIKFTGNAAYNAGSANYNSSHFSNVYLDGGRPSQNITSCIDCNDTSGHYLTAVFQGGVVANSKTAVVNVRGTNNMRIELNGVLMNGWLGEEPPRLFNVNNPNAKVFVNNCMMQFSHRSIWLQTANVVQFNGGWLLNGSDDFVGTAFEVTGAVGFLSVQGLYLQLFGGSTAFNDTGTGKRSFSGMQGDWPSSRVPTLTIGATNIPSNGYLVQDLDYERIGPLLYIDVILELNPATTPISGRSLTGSVRVSGLGSLAAPAGKAPQLSCFLTNLLRARAGQAWSSEVIGNQIRFLRTIDDGTQAAQTELQHTDIRDNSRIRVSGVYPVANWGPF